MNIQARKAMMGDKEELVDLWKRFVSEERNAVDDGFNLDEESEKWAWRLDRQIEQGVAFVVLSDDEIVGFTCYVGYREANARKKHGEAPGGMRKLHLAPGVAFISDIYVEPSARESPAAKLLFEALVDDIKKRAYRTIWTNTSVRNRRTQILLERIGFERTEVFKIPSMENQVYYEKKVG